MIILPILTTSHVHFSSKGWRNVRFDLGSGSVEMGARFHIKGFRRGTGHESVADFPRFFQARATFPAICFRARTRFARFARQTACLVKRRLWFSQERMATKIDSSEGSFMAELEGMETKRLEASTDYAGKLEDRSGRSPSTHTVQLPQLNPLTCQRLSSMLCVRWLIRGTSIFSITT